MTRLKEGDAAPVFALPDAQGKIWDLRKLKGTVVLYFYPKDDTPGCTTEACGFRDHAARFEERHAQVLGVSADDQASHRKFAQKHGLAFPLLVDEDAKTAKAYGAWGKKKFMGKEYEGIIRSTFVIRDGRVASAEYEVMPEGHAERVLGAL